LFFCQGITDYEPLRRNRRERLEELQTGDGQPLPEHLKAQVVRELDRLELLLQQIRVAQAERDLLVAPKPEAVTPTPGAMLQNIT
jgi:transposase